MAIERRNIFLAVLTAFLGTHFAETTKSQDRTSQQRELVTESMKRAATYYRDQVSVRGGYVYHYTLDLKTRWGDMERDGEKYSLTYDDQRLPEHYGWKTESRVELLEKRFQQCKAGKIDEAKPLQAELTRQAASIVKQLDADGRWVTTFSGERLVGQPKFTAGDRYLSSQIFSKNLTALAEFLQATK